MRNKYYAKIGKGLLIAMGGAACTYLLAELDMIDIQAGTPVYVALLASIINVIKVWLQSKQERKDPGA